MHGDGAAVAAAALEEEQEEEEEAKVQQLGRDKEPRARCLGGRLGERPTSSSTGWRACLKWISMSGGV